MMHNKAMYYAEVKGKVLEKLTFYPMERVIPKICSFIVGQPPVRFG
jgi:hypothetical protein